MSFNILKKDSSSRARLGQLQTAHGVVETPIFMPVGTRGAVKAVTNQQLESLNAQIILANTYHLMLRPGKELLEQAGGLHALMQWKRPLLTDSGGFQVFSLSSLRKVTSEGVHFHSHIDGSRHFLGPKESMTIQRAIGADIVMAFDECLPYPSSALEVAHSLERTHRWEAACLEFPLHPHQNLFGIVQGGLFESLRIQSAKHLSTLPFAGFAIGGLSVGEPPQEMYRALEWVEPWLPEEKPRYLMGVGTPRDLIEAVMRGVDMFDCVMPTRNARNGTAFTWAGKLPIKAGRYAHDLSPLDPLLHNEASCMSKAYVRHLLNVDEITGLTLMTIQNLAFYLDFMAQLRQALKENRLTAFYEQVCAIYP